MERHDLYRPIHKALRLLMVDTLTTFGALDPHDEADLSSALEQLDTLLGVCRVHMDHENSHVHTAMEAVSAGASLQAAQEHRQHRREIDDLAGDLRALRSAATSERARLAQQIYRHLARFVADNLKHMAHEERAHNALLWAHYDDDQLRRIEAAIVADTEPATMMSVLRWMLPALNAQERLELVDGMRRQMPEAGFDQVLQLSRAVLSTPAWAVLARQLAVPPEPGLVAA
jgi:hypothetical protein